MANKMELIPVVELRQWAYCPRVVYYHLLMTGAARPTYKMQEGLRAQELIEKLEMRRTMREYGLEGAERQFGVRLDDERSSLTGRIDLLLNGKGSAAVVDFKLTAGEVRENHHMQLAGYALLVEGALGAPVRTGFVYRIPDDRVVAVEIDSQLRDRVTRAVDAIREMQRSEELPGPTAVRGRCEECEYANYCADIW